MYTWEIELGDWSYDGHGRTKTFTFSSNFSHVQVKDFFEKIMSVTRFNIENLCSDYGDNKLTLDHIEQLKDLGFFAEGYQVTDGDLYVDREYYIDLLIFLLKKVEPTFEATLVKIPVAIIGVGYGLFS